VYFTGAQIKAAFVKGMDARKGLDHPLHLQKHVTHREISWVSG
jgi:hypothetical protein